jgi:peptidyl-prolyl cis-trans isomerase SurA
MNFRDFSFFTLLLAVGAGSASGAELVDRVVAIVNKRAIYKTDLDRFRNLIPLRAKIDPLFNGSPLARKRSPPDEEVLQFLIDEAIVADKFPANDAEVEQEINTIQSNLKTNRESLRSAIAREGFKFEDYFGLMRVALSKRQLIDREIRNKAAVSDDDIRAEYNRTHSGTRNFSGSFHLYAIRILKSKYKTPALAKEVAVKALDSIRKGEPFEAVARQVSDDPTQESGGELGYLSYSEMSPLLQSEVRKLGPEKVSGIIDDNGSLLILRVGDIKAEENDSAFTREKELLRSRLMEGEFQHQVELWIARERINNFVKINANTK